MTGNGEIANSGLRTARSSGIKCAFQHDEKREEETRDCGRHSNKKEPHSRRSQRQARHKHVSKSKSASLFHLQERQLFISPYSGNSLWAGHTEVVREPVPAVLHL